MPDKIKEMLQSRKFWVLVAAVVMAIGTHLSGQITTLEMVQLIIASLAVYSTGIAIVSSGQSIAVSEAAKINALVAVTRAQVTAADSLPAPDPEHQARDNTYPQPFPEGKGEISNPQKDGYGDS